ncbi:MAG: hypothetical protein V4529_16995 [Gemmatimonadota bacterium]
MEEGQLGIGEELRVELVDCTIVQVPRGLLEEALRNLQGDNGTNDNSVARVAERIKEVLNG